jgi:hypothetical protein
MGSAPAKLNRSIAITAANLDQRRARADSRPREHAPSGVGTAGNGR